MARPRFSSLADGLERLWLPHGYFIDRATLHHHAANQYNYRYALYESGAAESGCALFRAGSDILAPLLAKFDKEVSHD